MAEGTGIIALDGREVMPGDTVEFPFFAGTIKGPVTHCDLEGRWYAQYQPHQQTHAYSLPRSGVKIIQAVPRG